MGTPAVNYGPAKSLGDDYSRTMQKLMNVMQMLHIAPAPPPIQPPVSPDTSWHDQQVQKANQGFRDADAQRLKGAQKLGRIPAKE